MKVVEIFNSIEGEGKRAGIPCTFIRLHGCNLNCTYCDSRYAWQEENFTVMSVEEILDSVKRIGCPNITITGGEPLFHEGVDLLIRSLRAEMYEVNVETNGSIVPHNYGSRVFFTVDYKTNASGMSDKMNEEAFKVLKDTDVIKCVVGSWQDMEQSLNFIERFTRPSVYISPVFGKIEPEEIVRFIKFHKLWNWHVQVQLHKIIWNPEERGV